jgi:hypothetical protein
MSKVYGRHELTWRTLPDGSYALHCYGRRRAMLYVVPDERYDSMWRVRTLGSQVSDMANLSRAKDGAAQVELSILNVRRDAPVSPPMRRARTGGATLAAA